MGQGDNGSNFLAHGLWMKRRPETTRTERTRSRFSYENSRRRQVSPSRVIPAFTARFFLRGRGGDSLGPGMLRRSGRNSTSVSVTFPCQTISYASYSRHHRRVMAAP